jgi:phenylacetate-CoA ligase
LLAILYQLHDSERWDAARLRDAQQSQLEALFTHARQHVPFYSARLPDAAPELGGAEWLRLPELTRSDLQGCRADLQARLVPTEHGRVAETRTSGSTGQPVSVLRTGLNQLLWEAFTLREHLWHKRDASLSKAVVRANGPPARPPEGRRFDGWGRPYDRLWRCGPAFALDMTTDPAAQAEWLRKTRPAYLLTYPTNLEALLDCFAERDAPRMHQVICIGETTTADLQQRCKAILGAELVASYSSQELGYMALQCPDCGQYHVQSESVVLEVLAEDRTPCSPGKIGRVVVTDLHNFAMPLIRYAIGDYAEVGDPCSAGRGLPTLRRVLGRRRNMIVFPDGRRHWPLTGFHRFGDVAPIRQYQFVQHTRDHIEVRLVADRPLSKSQRDDLSQIILGSFGYPFRLSLRELEGPLPRSPGGKFEEFVCLAN